MACIAQWLFYSNPFVHTSESVENILNYLTETLLEVEELETIGSFS